MAFVLGVGFLDSGAGEGGASMCSLRREEESSPACACRPARAGKRLSHPAPRSRGSQAPVRRLAKGGQHFRFHRHKRHRQSALCGRSKKYMLSRCESRDQNAAENNGLVLSDCNPQNQTYNPPARPPFSPVGPVFKRFKNS